MARTPVNGLVVAFAATFGATKAMSAITNAAQAVATLEAAHGVVVSDILQIVTSGWPRADSRVLRASAVNTNDITLESFDTLNTTDYPTGTGAGAVREVTAWTNVGQILGDSFQSSGGEQQYYTYQYLDQDVQTEEPTFQSSGRIQFTIDDDIAAAGQALLNTLSNSRAVTPFRLTARTGAKWFGAGVVSLGVSPQFASNTNVRRTVSIALNPAVLTAYAS
jgi:hypothetical protein